MKDEKPNPLNIGLIKRYVKLCDSMHYFERQWCDVWYKMNMFNLSSSETQRRRNMFGIYKIFAKVSEDANSFDIVDNFTDDDSSNGFRTLRNREIIWQKILYCAKVRWPNGFFVPKNSKVVAKRCIKCNDLLEYHLE